MLNELLHSINPSSVYLYSSLGSVQAFIYMETALYASTVNATYNNLLSNSTENQANYKPSSKDENQDDSQSHYCSYMSHEEAISSCRKTPDDFRNY